jgi:general secretion pathway protein C
MNAVFSRLLTQRALDLLTAAMVISVAIALAGLTWRIAGHAGTGAVTMPSGRSAPAAATIDITPALALNPFGKATITDAGQPTGLPLELRGVIQAQPVSLSTAFIAVGGAPATSFQVGQVVSGATIEGILRDRVLLRNGGRIEYLAFPDPTLTVAQRAGQQPGQPAAAPGTATIPATPPAPTPAPSPQSLLQRLDATPTGNGMRIGGNAPPGLMPGDVIQTVNGSAVTDPSAAAAALAQAQQSGSAQIQILRDGKRITLTVPTR